MIFNSQNYDGYPLLTALTLPGCGDRHTSDVLFTVSMQLLHLANSNLYCAKIYMGGTLSVHLYRVTGIHGLFHVWHARKQITTRRYRQDSLYLVLLLCSYSLEKAPLFESHERSLPFTQLGWESIYTLAGWLKPVILGLQSCKAVCQMYMMHYLLLLWRTACHTTEEHQQCLL